MRLAKLTVLTAAAVLLTAGSASAAFHLMKVSEVYPGTALNPDGAFIELQMTSAGQNQVSGHAVTVYDAVGAPVATVPMGANVPNAQNNRTILLGDSNVSGRDFEANVGTLIAPGGGAVCFADASPPDCVAWGSFVEPMSFPGATGAPAVPGGIPDGQSISRTKARGCPTLLEEVDDTDDSATDFALGAPSPRPNTGAVTEQPCSGGPAPVTKIDSAPKKKTTSRKARFEFSADLAGATFECNLDDFGMLPCSSPKIYRKLKRGKHTFAVRATAGGTTDRSPVRYSWKIKKKKRKR